MSIFNFQFSIFNGKSGFTVLETIIAITIVALAVAGAASAVRTGLVGSSTAKEQIKAYHLAQEAVEVIRNKRDSNTLANYNNTLTNWLAGIAAVSTDPCFPGKTCKVDASLIPPVISECSGGWSSCSVLNQHSTTFAHGYDNSSGWVPTRFKREVQIENISSTEISVSVQVTWTHGESSRSLKTKTILMKWF